MRKCVKNSILHFRIVICIGLTILVRSLFAQDPQFTQFYSAPVYLNPAFTGNTTQLRAGLNYRNQWAAISGGFVSYSFVYDHNFPTAKSGLGLISFRDVAGSGKLGMTKVGALYSYTANINRKSAFRSGIEVSGIQNTVDFSQFTFSSELEEIGNAAVNATGIGDRMYLDIGAGMLYYAPSLWVGVAVHHLNHPNQSLINQNSPLPMKFSSHGGYNITLKKTVTNGMSESITVAYNYKAQAKFDQLDLGMYYYNENNFVVGLWYRGLPVKRVVEGYSNNDAIALIAGYMSKKFRLGYSYDITISKLAGNTGGAHELSLIFEYASKKSERKKYGRKFFVPCPKF